MQGPLILQASVHLCRILLGCCQQQFQILLLESSDFSFLFFCNTFLKWIPSLIKYFRLQMNINTSRNSTVISQTGFLFEVCLWIIVASGTLWWAFALWPLMVPEARLWRVLREYLQLRAKSKQLCIYQCFLSDPSLLVPTWNQSAVMSIHFFPCWHTFLQTQQSLLLRIHLQLESYHRKRVTLFVQLIQSFFTF